MGGVRLSDVHQVTGVVRGKIDEWVVLGGVHGMGNIQGVHDARVKEEGGWWLGTGL